MHKVLLGFYKAKCELQKNWPSILGLYLYDHATFWAHSSLFLIDIYATMIVAYLKFLDKPLSFPFVYVIPFVCNVGRVPPLSSTSPDPNESFQETLLTLQFG